MLTEIEAQQITQLYPSLTPENQSIAKTKLQAYRDDRHANGKPLFPTWDTEQRRARDEQENWWVNDAPPVWGKAEDADTLAQARRIQLMAQVTGGDKNEIATRPGAYRNAMAEVWGNPAVVEDDAAFDAEAKKQFQKQRDFRVLLQGDGKEPAAGEVKPLALLQSAGIAALKGKDSASGYGEWLASAGSKIPEYESAKGKDLYALYDAAHSKAAAGYKELRGKANAIYDLLKTEMNSGAPFADTSAAEEMIQKLSPDQREMIGQFIAKRAKHEERGEKKIDGKWVKGLEVEEKSGAQKSGETVGRVFSRLAEAMPSSEVNTQLKLVKFQAGDEIKAGSENNPAALITQSMRSARELQTVGAYGGGAYVNFDDKVKLTAAQAEAANAEVEKEQRTLRVRAQLLNWATGTVDPVKGEDLAARIGLGTLNAVASIASYAMPGGALMNTVAYIENERTRLENLGVDKDTAALQSVVVGGVQSVIEKFQVQGFTRLVGLRGALGKLTTPSASMLGAIGKRTLATAPGFMATQVGQEVLQDSTPKIVQGLLAAAGADEPNVGLEELGREAWATTTETFLSMLPLALIGAGAVGHSDFKQARQIVNDPAGLKALGFSEEQIAKITDEKLSGPGAVRALQEEWASRTPILTVAQTPGEQAAKDAATNPEAPLSAQIAGAQQLGDYAAADTLLTKREEIKALEADLEERGYSLKGANNNGQVEWTVRNEETGEATTHDNWASAYKFAHNKLGGMDMEDAEALGSVAHFFVSQNLDDEITISGAQKLAFDRLNNTPEQLDAMAERVRIEERRQGLAEGSLVAPIILGENQVEAREIVGEAVKRLVSKSKVHGGSNVFTVIEEVVEGRWKKGLMTGAFTHDEGVQWVRIAEGITGETYLDPEAERVTQQDLTEAISHIVNAEVFNRARSEQTWGEQGSSRAQGGFKQLGRALMRGLEKTGADGVAAGKFKTFLHAMNVLFKSIFTTASKLAQAQADGKLGEDYHDFVDNLLGLSEQARHNEAVAAAAVAEDQSQGTDQAAETAAIMERMGPGPNLSTLEEKLNAEKVNLTPQLEAMGVMAVRWDDTLGGRFWFVVDTRAHGDKLTDLAVEMKVGTGINEAGGGALVNIRGTKDGATAQALGLSVSQESFSIREAASEVSRREDLIPAPNGKQEWGKISSGIVAEAKKQSGHDLSAGAIVLPKGEHFSEHRGFGAEHVLTHEADFKAVGMSLEKGVLGILDKPSELRFLGGDRYLLLRKGKPNTVMVMEFRARNGVYSIVTAYPLDVRRDGSQRELGGQVVWKGSHSFTASGDEAGRLSRSEENKSPSSARFATDQTGEDTAEKGDSQETYSIASSDYLENIATRLDAAARDPQERLASMQRAAEALHGMARAVAHNDANSVKNLGKAALKRDQALLQARRFRGLQGEVESQFRGIHEAMDVMTLSDSPLMDLLTTKKPGAKRATSRIMSEADARRLGYAAGAGEYDGAQDLPRWMFGGTRRPDQLAQEAFEEGLIKGPYADDLWEAIDKALSENNKVKARYEEYKAAIREARAVARDEAATWADKQRKEQGSIDFERRELNRAMAAFDMILMKFPPEVRQMVGGFTKLAGLKTNKARFEFFKDRVEKLERAMEVHLQREYTAELRKLIKRSEPKGDKGEKIKGKIGASAHEWFMQVSGVLGMSETAVADRLTAIEARLAEDLEADEQMSLSVEWSLLHVYGNWRGKDAQGMASAYNDAQSQFDTGRAGWITVMGARRDEREALRGQAIEQAGGKGTRKAEDDGGKRRRKRWAATNAAGWVRHLYSFQQVLADVFGRGSALENRYDKKARQATRNERAARILKEQEFEVAMNEIYGTKNRLQRQQMLWDLSQVQEKTGIIFAETGTKKTKIEVDVADRILSGQMEGHGLKGYELTELRWAMDEYLDRLAKGETRAKSIEYSKVFRGKEHEKALSKAQAMHLWMTFQMEEYKPALARDGVDEITMEQIGKFLSPADKALMGWIGEQYENGYERMNAPFTRLYGVHLPKVKNYAPGTFQTSGNTKVAMPGESADGTGAMASGFLRKRKNHTAPLDLTNEGGALAFYWRHVAETEHWIAWAENVDEMKSVMFNRDVNAAVKAAHGVSAADVLRTWVDTLENDGVRNGWMNLEARKWLQGMMTARAKVGLAWKVSVWLKQATAAFGVMLDLLAGDFARSAARVLSGTAAMSYRDAANLPVMSQRRKAGGSPEMRMAMQSKGTYFRPGNWGAGQTSKARVVARWFSGRSTEIMDTGMDGINFADALFTRFGAAVAYDAAFRSAVRSGMTADEARVVAAERADSALAKTAQPVETSDKSLLELSMPTLAKPLFMFLSEARQKSALEIAAISNWLKGKGTWKEAGKIIFVNHVLFGTMTWALGAMWRDLMNDDDDTGDDPAWEMKDWLLAIVTGPLAGIPVLGDVISATAAKFTGARLMPNEASSPFAGSADDFLRGLHSASGELPEGEELEKALKISGSMAKAMSQMIGGEFAAAGVASNVIEQMFSLADNVIETQGESESKALKKASNEKTEAEKALEEALSSEARAIEEEEAKRKKAERKAKRLQEIRSRESRL